MKRIWIKLSRGRSKINMHIDVITCLKKEQSGLFLETEKIKIFGGFDFSKAKEIFSSSHEHNTSMIP